MQLQSLHNNENGRPVGAVVIRSQMDGKMSLDFGPADGPPYMRITLSDGEAHAFIDAVTRASNTRNETVFIADDV